MEADWEVEVGGGAPVIEALWPGFVDLRLYPERIGEIQEAAGFPALAGLLRSLNGAGSSLWTAKCDLWEPEANDSQECDDSRSGKLDSPCRKWSQIAAGSQKNAEKGFYSAGRRQELPTFCLGFGNPLNQFHSIS